MTLTSAETSTIVTALALAGWDEAVVRVGDVTISVGRNGVAPAFAVAVPAPATAPPAPATAPVAATTATVPEAPVPASPSAAGNAGPSAARETAPTTVTAPSVGLFRRGPSGAAARFVEIGARVRQGDVLGVVDVMTLAYDILAPCAGVVTEFLVDDAGAVQFGDVLLTLTPEPV